MLTGMTHVALTLLALVSSFWEGKAENKQIHHYEPELESSHITLFVKWSEFDESTFLLAIGSPKAGSSSSSSHSQLFMATKASDEKFVEIPMYYPKDVKNFAEQMYLNGSRLLITDIKNNVVCSTKDFTTLNTTNGLACSKVDFNPRNVIFHKFLPEDILVLDSTTNKLYHSGNYGGTWEMIAEKIYSVDWESWSGKNAIFVTRLEADDAKMNKYNVIKSTDFFRTTVKSIIDVERFELHHDFLFAISRVSVGDYSEDRKNVHLNLYVSHKEGTYRLCHFFGDENFSMKAPIEFKVIDVYDGQAFLVVGYYFADKGDHENGPFYHDLYISDVYGTRFQLSLRDIGYISSHFDGQKLLEETEIEGRKADFYSVLGLEGVFIASVELDPGTSVAGKPEKRLFQSVITYNKGASWESIAVPSQQAGDVNGQTCDKDQNNECRVQIAQSPIFRANIGSAQPVYSSSSAPGMVVATGFVGNSLTLENFTETNGDTLKMHQQASYMFISVNGGVSFSLALRGLWIHNFLDSGGFIVSVEPYSPTTILWFTFNQGSDWHTYAFSDKPMRVYDAKTKPGEKTTILTIFASLIDTATGAPDGNWRIVNVDFSDYFDRNCAPGNEADYDLEWKVNEEGRTDLCILGKQETFVRRHQTVECLNGPDFESKAEQMPCICSRQDYKCDFGATHRADTNECVLENGQGKTAEEQCADHESNTFFASKGYARILGDQCEPGEEAYAKWEPLHRACPGQPPNQFLLVLDRHDVHRLTIVDNKVEDSDKIIDVGPHNALISIAYSYSQNVLFYVEQCNHDSRNSMVKTLDFTSMDPPKIIHERDGESVVDVDVDFVNNNVYWIARDRTTNDHSIMMSNFNGAMKRTIVSKDDGVHSAKALSIDPYKGFIFWMDWSQPPFIKKATNDGRSVSLIVTENLFWSESLTVDLFTDEPKGWIYWVESFYGRIERAHYDGSNRKIVLALSPNNILSAATIFKNFIYLGLEGEARLAVTDKEHSDNEVSYTGPVFAGTDDSDYPKEIYSFLQSTHNNETRKKEYLCGKDNGGCSHICIQLNPTTHVCLCPDGMKAEKGEGSLNETCSCPPGETLNGKECRAGETKHCGEGMFKCANTVCIPERWRCDFTADCTDNSDEEGCNYEQCQSFEFTCEKTKKCIPKIWQCDFDFDCGEVNGVTDTSDEMSCDYPKCKETEYQCKNKKCIAKDWVCDHDQDCLDHSDEDDCTVKMDEDVGDCHEGGFLCEDKKLCIPSQWKCDGFEDCEDKSDEKQCSAPKCNSRFQFECKNPTEDGKTQCIYSIHVCDGNRDCEDGSDEDEGICGRTSIAPAPQPVTPGPDVPNSNGTCPGDDILCPSISDSSGNPAEGNARKCIPANWFCDHVEDCTDGTDELNCQSQDPETCTENFFKCVSGSCVPKEWRCDGVVDCGDSSDEKDCDNHGVPADECPGVDEFSCVANGRLFCFSKSVICDGYNDCPDKSDEVNCDLPGGDDDEPDEDNDAEICGSRSATVCEAHRKCALCGDKTKCIPKKSKCDHAYDCVDKSDEFNCQDHPEVCNDESFKCKLGDDCYPSRYVCDGDAQCTDGSDEGKKLCAGVKTGQVVEIYATEAVVTWGIPEDVTGMKQFHIQWKLVSSSETTKGNSAMKPMIVNSLGISGLVPYKKYEVSVFVEYEDGETTEKAAWKTDFLTKEALPSPPQKFSINTQNGFPGTVRASWSKPLHPNGEIIAYHVFYRSANAGLQKKQSFPANAAKDRTNVTIDGLLGERVTEFWVAAENHAGVGNATAKKTVDFNSDLNYYDVPKKLRISDKSHQPIKDKAIITWEPVTVQSDSDLKVEYRVTWKLEGDETINGLRTQTVSKNEISLDNLSPGECYCVEVSTVFGKEESQLSEPLTFQTSGGKLPVPVHLECSFANQKRFESLKLSWSLPENVKGKDVEKFGVYLATNPQKLHSVFPLKVPNSGLKDRKSSTIISDLLSGTSYFLAVRIIELENGVKQWGPVSKTIRCPTENNPMTPPRDLQCLPSATSSNITLSWKAPRESMLKNYTYSVMWKYAQDDHFEELEKQNRREIELQTTFSSNSPGADFEFQIEAVNATGLQINPSQIVRCSSANRKAPIVNLAFWNLISWTPPETMNLPNKGYIVYGIEKLNDFESRAVDKWMRLGETPHNQTYWKDFDVPQRIRYVTVALKPYKIDGKEFESSMGEVAAAKEVIFKKEASHITVNDLVHDRLMLKIMLPVAFVVLGLLITVGMLYRQNKQLKSNINIVYNKENGITILGEPDDVSQSSVPYGRLQANAEDYNDDVMLVNT